MDSTVMDDADDATTSMDYSKNEGEDLDKGDGEEEEAETPPEPSDTKALDVEEAGLNEAGTLVVKTLKGYENEDFSTLNLSHENVEKAYEAFKAEQLEKIAYEDLQKTFAARFETENAVRKSDAERAEYDARSEVAGLKAEFAELRKSLTEKDEEIRKSEEVAFSLPEGFPTSVDEAAGMEWSAIHNLVGGV